MRVWENVQPREVFRYFEELCAIPHGSGNTAAVSAWLAGFARERNLKYRQEPCGNVIIWKDASPGCEAAPVVMLQGHMDMVAVKTAECDLDLRTQGLRPALSEDGQWVYAEGTSLGADDGIAIAYALAILADDTLVHPPLEAVFTVDEEVGLIGASLLDASDLHSRFLLNLDSEEDGIFLTSCAGGGTFVCLAPAEREEKTGILYEWRVQGLLGGHSGSDIDKDRLNANLLFGRFLAQVVRPCGVSVGAFTGGEKENAIPNSCRALLLLAPGAPEDGALETSVLTDAPAAAGRTRDADLVSAAGEKDASGQRTSGKSTAQTAVPEGALTRAAEFLHRALAFADTVCAEYRTSEPELRIELVRIGEGRRTVLTQEALSRLSLLLAAFPAGIQRRMPDIPDMVQTSLSLGILQWEETEPEIRFVFCLRSSSESEKNWLICRMEEIAQGAGCRSVLLGVYSAWEYRQQSRLREMIMEAYREVSGEEPVFTGIHAGVECGIFCEKLPGIDCISYGPEIRDIHTYRERMQIASVKKTYALTCRVLEKLAVLQST